MDKKKVKISGVDPTTKRNINFFVEPEVAEKATQNPSYKDKLVMTMLQSINKIINTSTIKKVEEVAPLILSDGMDRYTLYVSQSNYPLFATKLLEDYKKSLEDGLKNVISTNFVQEDFTSVTSGSNWKFLDIYDIDADETHRLTLSPEDYQRAQIDMQFATKLLQSYKTMCNLPLNENNANACNVVPERQVQAPTISEETAIKPKKQSDRTKLNDVETRCLLTLYSKYIESYDTGKLIYDKFWRLITLGMVEKGYEYTSNQCINRMDLLKRKYKAVIDHNAETGKDPVTCPYFEEFHQMFHKKPWIKPLSTAGSGVNLDIDDVEKEYNKSKKSKLSGGALKQFFVEQTLDNQRRRLEFDKEYKKEKLKILREIMNRKKD